MMIMETKFVVTVRATSITIFPGQEALSYLDRLIELMTYDDEFVEETKTLGFMYDESTDTLYLHKGVDIEYLHKTVPHASFKYDNYHDFKEMNFEYDEVIPPRNDEQVDVINFIAGLNHHSENLNDRQLFLVKNAGFGKAQPYSTKIPTPMTRPVNTTIAKFVGRSLKAIPVEYNVNMDYIQMGELKVGDLIFDRFGKPTTVTHIFDQGELDVYKITFEDGRHTMCCLEHLWCVFVGGKPKYQILNTCEMIDMLKEGTSLSVPICQPPQYSEKPYVGYECGSAYETIYHNLKDTYLCSSEETIRELFNSIGIKEYLLQDEIGLLKMDEKFANDIYIPLLYQMGYHAFYRDGHIHYWGGDKLKIKSIEYSHKEKCRCIIVDNPDHTYLTENFIVTHNTFCSGVGMCKFGVKTLIIVHRDSLRTQWMNSLCKMQGLTHNEVHEISEVSELCDIARGYVNYDYDIYLMTHATFRAATKYLSSMEEIGNITKNLGIGLKIIDEAHLEFRDTLFMDFCFNVKRNLYLTATDGRSAKEENTIFRKVFSNATFYRPSSLLETGVPKRWTTYVTVAVNTHCKPNIYRYRVAGGRGMNPASYGKWVIQYDKNKTHFKCCRDLLKIIYNRDQYAKVLVFMPLIDLCSDAAYFFSKELNYSEDFDYDLNIKTINSKNSKSENDANRSADVIVTTIASCGTGTDIHGITDIISCSPYCSRITAEQSFGRIRYCGKECHYYDIYDESVLMDRIWIKSRRKKIKQLALNIQHLNWSEDEEV